jgi:N-acyl-D-aspartate/D-glutamate deacylase
MLEHSHTVPGLGDGGAHLGMIADASFTTWMLTHWVRDRTRGPRLTLPFAVHAITARTADAVGLGDRGRLLPGLRADLNLIDLEGLRLRRPRIVEDLPAGGRRLLQAAEGYRATVVAGQVVALDGVPTGALPGRLVRGARVAPLP